jgi:choice-of-anchor B domain-containing protein
MRTFQVSKNHFCVRHWGKGLLALAALLLALLGLLAGTSSVAHDDSMPGQGLVPPHARDAMRAFAEDHHHNQNLSSQAITSCSGGMAGSYPCSNVDLMAFLPLAQIGGGNGNDVWGWTDPGSSREYAIMGLTNGTAFVDVTDPVNPLYLGHLPPPAGVLNSSWRDIKVYANHAFIGSEALGSGLQIMDLAQLGNVPAPPVTFVQTAHYTGFSTSHNVVINEDSGYAYGVGTNNGNCGRGLHFVNIANPASPQAAGCFGNDGYTHDAQCVNYSGPDIEHLGKEICFAYNEDTLTIVDVSDKASPLQISRTPYPQSNYTHQGWLTEDHTYLLMDDELDERNRGGSTRTLMWDMADLDTPVYMGYHAGVATSIDHNQYIKGDYSYQANYTSGLRILDISDVANGNLSEVGFFDIYPDNDAANFNAAWSVYPFFDSGTVIVSGIEQGLYVLRPNLGTPSDTPQVSLVNPTDLSPDLVGIVQVQIAATDTEDDPVPLSVDWNIDGGAWQNTSYVDGHYVADWDTSSVLDGPYTVNARAVDSDLREGQDSVTVTVANGAPDFRVDSVYVSIISGRGSRNTGEATISVVDDNAIPLAGVFLEGDFSGDWNGTRSGTTDSSGQLLLKTPKVKNLSFLQYCVTIASLAAWNLDTSGSTLCGDSNGGGSTFGALAGRVTDADTSMAIANAGVSTDTSQNGSTDSNGDYSLTNVPVGNRTVSVSANGYDPDSKAATVNDSVTTTANFQLTAQSTGGGFGAIKGTVNFSNGGKLAGVLVQVDSGSSATSNNGGKYNIQNVVAGSHTVTASKSGYLPQLQDVDVDVGTTITVNFTLSAQ